MSRRSSGGFTLVEMMVATAVLVILLGIIAVATNSARQTITRATANVGTFAAARTGFNNITDKLSQATLNTYLDYFDKDGRSRGSMASDTNATTLLAKFAPKYYGRNSDLQFLIRQNTQNLAYGQEVYFQTPIAYSANSNYQSAQGLLNACSYFVEYCSDASYNPSQMGLKARYRYRLMQGMESADLLSVYTHAAGTTPSWIVNLRNNGAAAPASSVLPMVDNVIALIVWARLPQRQENAGVKLKNSADPDLANYNYNSQGGVYFQGTGASPRPSDNSSGSQWSTDNQIPPIVQLTMVVIDEASAAHIATDTATPPSVIETALAGKFQYTANYQTDIDSLSDITDPKSLSSNHINFRVFNTSVIMRESKWSQ